MNTNIFTKTYKGVQIIMGILDIFGSTKEKAKEAEAQIESREETLHAEQVAAAKSEHEGMPWPTVFPINLMRNQENKDEGITVEDPISAERKEEVGALVYEPTLRPDQMKALTLQELLFLLNTEILFNKKAGLLNFEKNHRIIHNDMLRRIHEAEKLYILYNKHTGYPLIDNGFGLVYLEKEHAEKAAELYQKQYRQAVVAERPGEAAPALEDGRHPVALFDFLYYLGIENVLIDNGWYKAIVQRNEISAPPTAFNGNQDPSKNPPTSPHLAFAMIDFANEAKWPVKYAKREEVLQAKMNRINALIPRSRYIVPVQDAEGTETKGLKLPLEKLKLVTKENPEGIEKGFLPVFTDLFEYSRGFKQKGYRPCGFDFKNVVSLLSGAEGIVINPRGESVVVPKEQAVVLLQSVLTQNGKQ